MIFELIFVRHGESCANVLLKSPNVKDQIQHKFYLDPELSTRGRILSLQKGPLFLSNLDEQNEESPFLQGDYTLGASELLRAQETAYLMIDKQLKESEQKPIFVFPFLGEEGVGGSFFRDNKAQIKNNQKQNLKDRYADPKLDSLLLYEKDARAGPPNFNSFILWAEEHSDWFQQGSDGVYRAIIVSHSNSLQKAFPFKNCVNPPEKLPSKEKLDNNDFLVTILNFEKEQLPTQTLLDSSAVYPKWHYFDTRELNEVILPQCGTKNNSCSRKNVMIKCKETKGGKRKTRRIAKKATLRQRQRSRQQQQRKA